MGVLISLVAIPLRENVLIFFLFGLTHAREFGWKCLSIPVRQKPLEIDFKLLKFKILRIDYNYTNYTTKLSFPDALRWR